MPFPTPVFRPGLKNPYPFSDLTLYVIKHSMCISAEWKSTLSLTSYSPFLSQLLLSHQVLARVAGKKNMFISFCERSHDNHTQSQTKLFKIYTRFQTKTAQKPYPLGQHIGYILDLGEYPPQAYTPLGISGTGFGVLLILVTRII